MLHITCVMTTSSKTQLIPTESLQSKRLLRSVHMSHASWRTCHQVTHMDSHWHSRVCVLSACTKGILKICTFYVNATQCTHFVSRSSTKRSTWPTPGPSHQYLVSFNKPQAWLWGGFRLSESLWHKKKCLPCVITPTPMTDPSLCGASVLWSAPKKKRFARPTSMCLRRMVIWIWNRIKSHLAKQS